MLHYTNNGLKGDEFTTPNFLGDEFATIKSPEEIKQIGGLIKYPDLEDDYRTLFVKKVNNKIRLVYGCETDFFHSNTPVFLTYYLQNDNTEAIWQKPIELQP